MSDTVTIFDPQGVARDIPYEQMQAALQGGGKPAVRVQAPDNSTRLVPADRAQEAASQGGKILPLEQQEVPHAGFWSALGSDLWSMAKAIPQMNPASEAGHAVDEYHSLQETGGLLKGKTLEQRAAEDRSAAGYGKGYSYLAAPLAEATGINVQGMEQSAKEGDTGGVLGHAAALPVAAAITEGALKVPAATRAIKPVVAEGATALARKTPIVKAFVDGPPEELMTRAIKPGKNNVGWNDAVKQALPQLKAAETELGHPVQGIDDALQAANVAKKQIWSQYSQRLTPAARIGAVIDGNAIADAMVGSIDRRTALQNPGLVERVNQVAETYRRPIPLGEAEDFLQSANNDLHSYYAKNKVGRRVAEGDPSVAYTVAEADALRGQLYSKLDELSGPGSKALKRQYGAITNVQNELTGRKNVAARQQPQSLNEQISTVRGAGKIARGVFTASPGDVIEGAENIANAKWLKERNSSDAMIMRAFKGAKPAPAITPPPLFRPSGLLQRGSVQMGAAPDASGAVPYRPPFLNPTTRAQRLGFLLPEKTAVPLSAPNAEAPMQVLKANKQVVRDPKTGRMKTMFQSSGKPPFLR